MREGWGRSSMSNSNGVLARSVLRRLRRLALMAGPLALAALSPASVYAHGVHLPGSDSEILNAIMPFLISVLVASLGTLGVLVYYSFHRGPESEAE